MQKQKSDWNVSKKIAITVGVLYLVIHYWDDLVHGISSFLDAASPLFLGAVIAYVVNILMQFYEKYYMQICKWSVIRKYQKIFCMTLAFLSVFLVLAVLWQIICPVLLDCIIVFAEKLPQTLDSLSEWLTKNSPECCFLLEKAGFMNGGNMDWEQLLTRISIAYLQPVNGMMESVVDLCTGIISGLLVLFLAVIFSIYLLLRKEKISRDIRHFLCLKIGKRGRKHVWYFLEIVNHSFRHFIIGQFVEAVILGALCMIGMAVFQFPYAGMIGSLVGVTALIPLAGAYVGAGIGALMIYTESPVQALLFLLFLVVLQQIEGNIIYPKVVGTSLGLPGIWVLASVIVGGSLWGILGMFLSVPLAASVYQMIQDYMKKNKNEKFL